MKKRFFSPIIKKAMLFAAILFIITTQSFSQAKKGYAPLNGLKMYYEVYGSGKPIVLLHGAFMNGAGFGGFGLTPELLKVRQVITMDMQGHGRTADTDRPFSFETMADDVAATMKYLKIDSADVLGYSMGGCVAWQMAIRHPEMVKRLIIISSVYKFEGWTPQTRSLLPTITPAAFEQTPLKSDYDSLAPDPKHWSAFITKMGKFVSTPFDFGADNIKAIKSPTLIVAADGDGVSTEHAVEMYRLRGGQYMVDFSPLPNAQLAIMPGTSHVSVMMQPGFLAALIKPFLDPPPPMSFGH